jgi:hypothetical protein
MPAPPGAGILLSGMPHARLLVAAATLALAAIAVLPAPIALAQGLELVGDARYDLAPAEGRIRVTIEFTATNRTPDTEEGRTSYGGVSLAIHPRAVAIRAQSDGQGLPTQVIETTDEFTSVNIDFNRDIFFEESYRFGLSYDLVDPGGAPARDLRIGRTLVTFPVWGFGSEEVGAGSVTVFVPAGYTPTVEFGDLEIQQLANGAYLLSAGVTDPLSFFAYVSAERPGAFTETLVDSPVCPGEACIVIRAWDDDPAWGEATADLAATALPALEELIGLDYPIDGLLTIEEAATAGLGDYAGLFDTFEDLIRIRYDADAFVALHELSHAWFNAHLFTDRWIDEAFASYYGARSADRLGLEVEVFRLTDDLLPARIALNDWGELGREDLAVEDYAYAATYELALLIAARAGDERLQEVWRASAARELAYQPIHADNADPDVVSAEIQMGWQRLLDLLEEGTGTEYADLWAEWVVSDLDLGLLDERDQARRAYRGAILRAGAWELPRVIRFQLASWRFDRAQALIAEATGVLVERNTIASLAESLDLEPTGALRSLFEEGELDQASGLAETEIGTLQTIRRAGSVLARPDQPVEVVGLLGVDPAMALSAARALYETGEVEEAARRADEAIQLRESAAELGRDRVLVGGAALLALDGLLVVAAGMRRARPAHPAPAR